MKGLQLGCLLLIGSLFALTGLRQFFLEPLPTPSINALWFFIQVLPLLGVVPGILMLGARSFLIAALISTLYFVHGVLLVATPELRSLGLWEAAFSVGLLMAGSYAARNLSAPAQMDQRADDLPDDLPDDISER
jgi:uncharacterized membrane protein